jgi:guanylate kinase
MGFPGNEGKGILIVISGPSGSGKGTVVDRLLDEDNIELSVSCTTRPPRPHEKDGVNYFFKREGEFDDMIVHNSFLEHARVFDCRYGTPRERVLGRLDAGKNVILEIDVQGAMQVRDNYEDALLIFIMPPSMDELANRLRNRATETEEQVRARLSKAEEEIGYAGKYDFTVINDVLEDAVEEIKDIIRNQLEERNK